MSTQNGMVEVFTAKFDSAMASIEHKSITEVPGIVYDEIQYRDGFACLVGVSYVRKDGSVLSRHVREDIASV